MRRRDFMALAAAAPPTQTIGLGFSLYAFRQWPLEKAIRLCAAIGYDGVELCLNPGWPAQPSRLGKTDRATLRDLLRHLKLGVPSLMEQLTLSVPEAAHQPNLARLRAAMNLAHDIAPTNPPLIETVLGGKAGDWDNVRERMADRLADWAGSAAELKTVIAIKAHVGGAADTPDKLNWLLGQIRSKWIRAVYDFSHFELAGLDAASTVKALAPHTAFVHVKDAEGSPAKYNFLLAGEGRTTTPELLRHLKASGYRGFIVPEVSSQLQTKPGYDAEAAARKCFANLTRMFKAAGIARPKR